MIQHHDAKDVVEFARPSANMWALCFESKRATVIQLRTVRTLRHAPALLLGLLRTCFGHDSGYDFEATENARVGGGFPFN